VTEETSLPAYVLTLLHLLSTQIDLTCYRIISLMEVREDGGAEDPWLNRSPILNTYYK